MKCNYGCPGYGKRGTCPPEVPSVAECIKIFKDPPMRNLWSREVNQKMLDLEREVFLSGYHKAFIFPRPLAGYAGSVKGFSGIAAIPTWLARKMGYPIQVLKDYHEEMNRYGLLLVE